MASFISNLHKDLRRARGRGSMQGSGNVASVPHKEYPRMERIALPSSEALSCRLDEAIERRVSRGFGPASAALSLAELGDLFGHALRRRSDSVRRQYPSGGGLYPIETYLLAERLEGAAGGVFHYHPTDHALERLWDLPAAFTLKDALLQEDLAAPSALIVFTSVWERSARKYGDFSYLLALLETGHMSENILLVSTALDLDGRAIAGFRDDALRDILDLDDEVEQSVLSVVLSKSVADPRTVAPDVIAE